VNAKRTTSDPVGACAKHWSVLAAGQCDDCGELWCSDCLVPPDRKRAPTRCVGCALVAAGVRTRTNRPTISSVSRVQRRPTSRW
jgi:hypothetical protein